MKYKLIKEYPGSPRLGNTIDNLENDWIENYPEFWQEVVEKDYEILEVKGKYGAISSYIEELDNDLKDKTIFKIKRLSDGEIFTIGDKVFSEYINYTINKIGIVNDKCMVSALYDTNNPNGSRLHYNLNNLKKAKQPLFTTEDGVDIFEGDTFYYVKFTQYNMTVGKPFEIVKGNHPTFKYEPQYEKYFSTKEKAEEYILLNKPCLSYGDVQEYLKIKDCNKVLDLAQSKIQQSV